MSSGDGEEQRYQAFKARFLEERRNEARRAAELEDKAHREIMQEVYGTHGQG